MTWKRRLFVKFYLGESKGNATDAARRAGYAKPGPEGCFLLKDPEIQAAIAADMSDTAMTADEILGRLADIAAGNIGEFMDPETGLVDVKKMMASGKTHLIHSIEPTANGPKVKLYSATEALTLLGRYRKLWVDRLSLEDFDPSKWSTEQLKQFVQHGRSYATSRN